MGAPVFKTVPTSQASTRTGHRRSWITAPPFPIAAAFRDGASWARARLAAQEPTDAEVEAAGEVWQAHSRLAHPIEDLEPSCAECGYAFGWPGISESEERKRHREHVARAALSAARAARRDEETP